MNEQKINKLALTKKRMISLVVYSIMQYVCVYVELSSNVLLKKKNECCFFIFIVLMLVSLCLCVVHRLWSNGIAVPHNIHTLIHIDSTSKSEK